MAAAFPFSFDKNFSSDNRGQDSSSGANISSSSLKCDLCREKPNSLSELRTLSCLHTLCKKCFRTQGAECPLCGYQLTIGSSSSSASGQQQIGNNSFVVSNRGMLPVQPAKTSTAATSSSSLVSSSTSGHSQSSQLSDAYVEQLTIDTSFLIGNLLETVSFEDTIALPQAQNIGSTNVRPYSTSSSSKQQQQQQQQRIFGSGPHPSSSSTKISGAAATATSSSLYFDTKFYTQPSSATQNPMQQQFQQQQQQQTQRLFYCSCAEGVEATSRCDDCDEFLCFNCVQAHLRVRVTKEHRIHRLPSSSATAAGASGYSSQGVATSVGMGPSSQQMSYSLRALSGVLSSSASFGSFPTTGTPSTSLNFPLSSSSSSIGPTTPMPPSTSSSTTIGGGSPMVFCNVHRDEIINLLCENCVQTLCRVCAMGVDHIGHQITYASSEVIARSRSYLSNLTNEIRQFVKNIEDTSDVVDRMTERVETRVLAVANEVRAVMHHHISALEERKRDLLQRIDAVRTAKVNALFAQREELRQHHSKLKSALDNVDGLLQSSTSSESEASKARDILTEQINYIKNIRPFLQQQEDDRVLFIGPDQNLLTALRNLGSIVTGAFAPNSIVIGDIYRRAIKDKVVVYTVQAKDHVGDSCTVGGDQVNVVVQTPDSYHYNGEVSDKKNGTYMCSFKPTMEGKHLVYIFIRAKPIHGSPFSLLVRKGRDYASVGAHPIFSFGGEGSEDGQLCRPWGITCDKQNRIIVADRSNNRVQIFDQNGKFLHKFGSPGCRNGQFDRPAGVAVNSKNQIVVVDKDNHRVQVFTSEGQFLFKFGEKGRSPGQFNYPWDCAVNNEDAMAVSDTRNHRVQLFSPSGTFLKKFGFESSLLFKQFDSPRGLIFAPDGRLLVTDFNNHRLVVIDLVHDNMDFVGREGEYESCFRRPQGIDVDLDGAILVADSRNNRIQAFSPQMQFVGMFGVDSGPSRTRSTMDRPCDLCVTPEGRIFVVDFGNNKIHVY